MLYTLCTNQYDLFQVDLLCFELQPIEISDLIDVYFY